MWLTMNAQGRPNVIWADTRGLISRAELGGQQQTAQWSRLFLVPGMGHCGGGPATLDQFDMLDAVVGWVEKGTAPEAIKAAGSAFPGRSRPLCSYPRHAHYKGSGDPQNADNFECRS